jgi:hypothetical protein
MDDLLQCAFCGEGLSRPATSSDAEVGRILRCSRCQAANLLTPTPENVRPLLAASLQVTPESLAITVSPKLQDSNYLVSAWDPKEMLFVSQVAKIMRVRSLPPVEHRLKTNQFPGAVIDRSRGGPGWPKWLIPRRDVLAVLRGQARRSHSRPTTKKRRLKSEKR